MNVVVSGADFVERIDEMLHLQNKKRSDMCRDLELKQNTISNWIDRNSLPRFDTGISICKYLNVNPEWLLTGSDNSNPAPKYQTFLNDVMALPEYDFEELQAIVKIKKDRLQKVTV